MKKELESLFKTTINEYIDNIDHLHLSSTFAPYEKYTVHELRGLSRVFENRSLLMQARESFLEFVKGKKYFETNKNNSFFADVEEMRFFIDSNKESKVVLYYLFKTAYISMLSFNTSIKEQKEISTIEDLKMKKRYDAYYRGQCLYEWRLSPTVFRGLNKSIIFDDNYYYKLLKDDGTERKYNELLKYNDNDGRNRYSKYAFMQHARSYSPFIDFTKDSVIAASFALSNVSSVNEFNNNDSALFTFYLSNSRNVITDKDAAKQFIREKLRIDLIHSDYFILGHEYKLLDSEKNEHIIKIDSLLELKKRLEPKVMLIDAPSNDRMIYQKGVFICFYDCISLNGLFFYELSSSFIRKEPILVKNKRNILDEIYKERKYDIHHLMDPYLLFRE